MNEVRNKIKSRLDEMKPKLEDKVFTSNKSDADELAKSIETPGVVVKPGLKTSNDKAITTKGPTPSSVGAATPSSATQSTSSLGENTATDGGGTDASGQQSFGKPSTNLLGFEKGIQNNALLKKYLEKIAQKKADVLALFAHLANVLHVDKTTSPKIKTLVDKEAKAADANPLASTSPISMAAGYVNSKPMLGEESINPKMTKGDLVKLVSENTSLKVVERIKVKDLKN